MSNRNSTRRGSRGQKRRASPARGPPTGAARGLQGSTNKRRKQNESVQQFNPLENPHSPLPIGYCLFCKYDPVAMKPCERVYPVKVVDRRRPQEPRSCHAGLWEYYIHFIHHDRRMDRWFPRNQQHTFQYKLDTFSQKSLLDLSEEELRHHQEEHKDDFSTQDLAQHDEITKVKNVDTITLGKYEMETWYFSPFPPEYDNFTHLYFDEFDLSFFGHEWEYKRHRARNQLRHPPGNEIYRSTESWVGKESSTISVFEIDGHREELYSQNLSYLAKLFLDHKSLRWDTRAFMFYVVTEVDLEGCHLVGYFSKEKLWYLTKEEHKRYNLACILTLPCHQRKGIGKFMITLSYALSQKEGLPGTPERPLSDLGRTSYERHWARMIVAYFEQNPVRATCVRDLSAKLGLTQADVKHTLANVLNAIRFKRGSKKKASIYISTEMIEQFGQMVTKRNSIRSKSVQPCDPQKLRWTPFKFPAYMEYAG